GRRPGPLGPAPDPPRLRLCAQPLVLCRARPGAVADQSDPRQPRDGPPLAAPLRPRLEAPPACPGPPRPPARAHPGPTTGVAAVPAGRRDGGVVSRIMRTLTIAEFRPWPQRRGSPPPAATQPPVTRLAGHRRWGHLGPRSSRCRRFPRRRLQTQFP